MDGFILAIKPSDIQSSYYNETNKAIAGIFKLASRLAKPKGSCCILFIGMPLYLLPVSYPFPIV